MRLDYIDRKGCDPQLATVAMAIATVALSIAGLGTAAAADAPTSDLLAYTEEIQVFGDAPVVAPVDLGEPVRIAFGIGQLEIEAREISEVRAELVLECRKVAEDKCARYKRRLRIEPVRTKEGLEVRMAGLSLRTLRRLEVTGTVLVPKWSPLDVQIGIGDVDIRAGEEDLSVRMGIGDLTVHAAAQATSSISMRTRIGDAGVIFGGHHYEGKRRMLIGAKVRWAEGVGDSHIEVGLRIGDARVRLE